MAGRRNTIDIGNRTDQVPKGETVDQRIAEASDFAIAESPVDREDVVIPNILDWNSLEFQSLSPAEPAQKTVNTDAATEDPRQPLDQPALSSTLQDLAPSDASHEKPAAPDITRQAAGDTNSADPHIGVETKDQPNTLPPGDFTIAGENSPSVDGSSEADSRPALDMPTQPDTPLEPTTSAPSEPETGNQAPTDIVFTGGDVDENAAAGTVVANLSPVDPDGGETFTYQIVDDPSGNFEVVKNGKGAGAQLMVADGATLDFETADSHDVSVQVTDSAGNSYVETIAVNVNDINHVNDPNDVNEAPTDISYASAAVNENAAAGTVVASLSPVDPDGGESFTYQIVDDPSGNFKVVKNGKGAGAQLMVADGATLDFEAAGSHDVSVQVTDSAGNTYIETIAVGVNDVNEASTDITLDNSTIDEGAAGGTVVGSLSATDPDTGDSFTYTLTDDAGGLFSLDGNELKVADGATLDFESAQSHDVTVEVTDAGGNTYSEVISLNVNDVPGQTINGTAGDDALLGTSEDDILSGGDGDDTLQGGGGDDTLIGSAGNDSIHFQEGDGNDSADGGAGGGWTDMVQLADASGGSDIGVFGTDWTLTLSEGSVISVDANSITLSDDADGIITLADGSEIQFQDFEVIGW